MTNTQKDLTAKLKLQGLTMIEVLKYLRDNDQQLTNDEVKQEYNKT